MTLDVLIMVSGTVMYDYRTARLSVSREFSESNVLVPTPAIGAKAHQKPVKTWLI